MVALQVAQQKRDRSNLPGMHEGDLTWYKPFPGTAYYRGDRTKLAPEIWARFDLPHKMPSEVAHLDTAVGERALGFRMALRYGKTERRW